MYESGYEAGAAIGLSLFMLLILLIPFIFYLITMQKTLEAISPQNRRMPPGNVWLMFIPLFNIVWRFIMNGYIADSIAMECYRLGIPVNEQRPTFNLGLAKSILAVCSIIPVLGIFSALGWLVCWIIYWVKVNEYKNLIIANRDNNLLDAERGIFHH